MNNLSLNLPKERALRQKISSPSKPVSRFFNKKSSNSRKVLPTPNRSHILTQHEFLAQLHRHTQQNLLQSQSVQNLHPYRPYSDGLVALSASRSQRQLPPIRDFPSSAQQPQVLKSNKLKFRQSRRQLTKNKLNNSQPIMSVNNGVVSFGDTTSPVNYQSFHSSSNQSLFVYRGNNSRAKQKKKFAKYLAKKPKKLQKFVKKNKKRVKMEKALKRRLSHENIYSEHEKDIVNSNSNSNTNSKNSHNRRIDTANSDIMFVNETERDEFLNKQEEFKKIAELPSITDSDANRTPLPRIPSQTLAVPVSKGENQANIGVGEHNGPKAHKKHNKSNSKRRQSMALSVDNANKREKHNPYTDATQHTQRRQQNSARDTDNVTNNSESLVAKLRMPRPDSQSRKYGDRQESDSKLMDVQSKQQIVYSIQSKNKNMSNMNVSEIIDHDDVASNTHELTNTLSLTEDALETIAASASNLNLEESRQYFNDTQDAMTDVGNLSKRSMPQTGHLTFRSMTDSVYKPSMDISGPSTRRYGNTDTVYVQNIGFTHRSSNTVNGTIQNDEHGLGMFLAKVKHHLSDPAQKRLQKSKSAMFLHDPSQIRDVLKKMRECTDYNCKWDDDIKLDDQLTHWWDEVKLFKMWVHEKDWGKWIEV